MLLRILFLGLTSAALSAQPVAIENARLLPLSWQGSLEQALQQRITAQQQPAWMGYSVPLAETKGQICCYDDCCQGCRLEAGHSTMNHSSSSQVQLEQSSRLLVLMRMESGQLQKVRVFSADCPLDAGGLDLYWLDEVPPAQSVAFLSGLAEQLEPKKVHRGALMAIAYHGHDSADEALESFVQPQRPTSLREQTAFWMGATRGERGLQNLRRLVRRDASLSVRKQGVFGISLVDLPEAESELLQLARQADETQVRRQAIFWLGQKAGRKAVEALTEAAEKDPEVEIQLHAVFALSQLPEKEGTQHLIRIARTHSSPRVRKRAIFWLGQSGSEEALRFFEEILSRK
ncbi:MAG: HEAT repeat domain-containing protein [Acidobacteriota bacterium]